MMEATDIIALLDALLSDVGIRDQDWKALYTEANWVSCGSY